MTIETADRIIGFLEKYNGVYRDMVAFLTEKQAKVMADDLLWLLDSVEDEQALVMKIQSEESARSALFEELGLVETVEKKLSVQEELMRKTGMTLTETYNGYGAKIKHTSAPKGFLGNI